jgi:hypothetical protein
MQTTPEWQDADIHMQAVPLLSGGARGRRANNSHYRQMSTRVLLMPWREVKGCRNSAASVRTPKYPAQTSARQMKRLLLVLLATAALPVAACQEHAKAGATPPLYDSKAEAEQAAPKFNCTGAHQMGAKWMPCDGHKEAGNSGSVLPLYGTKAEAEKDASKFNCTGAHQMGDKWMPCGGHPAEGNSSTAPTLYATKAEAEKAALKFNCVGAHKMGDRWMPCADHK